MYFQLVNRYLKTVFSVLVLAVVFCSSARAADEVDEYLRTFPLAVTPNGDIISNVAGFDEYVHWSASSGKLSILNLRMDSTLVAPPNWVPEFSADGTKMLSLGYVPSGGTQLSVVDTGAPDLATTWIPETRSMTRAPRLSPDGARYAFSGQKDPTSFGSDGLWIFNLGEYLIDTKVGRQQPTGFYLESVPLPGDASTPSPVPSFSGGRVGAAAWSADGTELAYVVVDGKMNTSSLYIYDMVGAKAEKVMGIALSPLRMEWPEGDLIYLEHYTGLSRELHAADRVKKTSSLVLNEAASHSNYTLTVDGRWAAFSNAARKPVLVDLKTKSKRVFEGASSMRLASNGKIILETP